MEVTKKIRFITPAILTLLVILSLTGSAMADTSKTYTLDDDFDEGTFVGVEHSTVKDQLQLTKEATTFPFMWIANAGEDTISKWDTNKNKELARYNTWFGSPASHDAWSGPSPSRTCVDVEGNCYVANRHFDYRPADVIKILLDDYVDRNGNGKLDTSTDSDNSGVITPDEMLPMTDTNNNGKIDDSEIKDERIAWAVSVGPENGLGRALAIDTEGNVWLGLYNEQAYYKLSSVDGSVLEGPISVSPNTPYGAAIDKHGILWGSSLSYNLLKLDTKTKDVSVYDHSNYGYDYGIALGYDDNNNTHVYQAGAEGNTYIEFNSVTETFSTPAQIQYPCYGIATDSKGNILASNLNTGEVTKFAPDGSVIWSAGAQVNSEARGTVVDSNDDVWVIHREASKLSNFSGSD
jgi:streptogramin lyase